MNSPVTENTVFNTRTKSKLRQKLKYFKKNYHFYLLLILPAVYFLIFKYLPMFGNIIAFRSYKVGGSIFGEKWVGLRYFEYFIKDPSFLNAFQNSLILSVMSLVICFPIPIIFALLLNEMRNKYAKRLVQTVSYMPKFISIVIIIGIVKEMLSPSTGIVNSVLENYGIEPIYFIGKPEWFRPLYIITDIWQFTGWNAIIYLAALSNIDIQLYDSAKIDGANRFKQTLHVTIPGIMPMIIITLILNVGHMLSLGFHKVLLLYNNSNSSTSDIIETFTYRMGLQNNMYSYATAVGLFGGIIGLILVGTTNYLAGKFTETSLF